MSGSENTMNRIVVEMTPDERDFLLMAVRMVKHETEHPTVVSTLKSGHLADSDASGSDQ